MDPLVFSILMPLQKMIDELRKRIAEGNAKQQARAIESIDEEYDISGLKAKKVALIKEVEIVSNYLLKAMESFYAVEDCLLTIGLMARPSTPPPHEQSAFYLPELLVKMKEELGQRIAEEKAARLERATVAVVPEVSDEVADIDAIKSENTALKSVLEVLSNDWMSMSAAFHAFVKNLTVIGLIMAPTEVTEGTSPTPE